MGWKQREAQAMVDGARTHVGTETKVEEAIRLALRQAPLPSGTMVREELATYTAMTIVPPGMLYRSSTPPLHMPS